MSAKTVSRKANGHDSDSPFNRPVKAGSLPIPAAERISGAIIIGKVTVAPTKGDGNEGLYDVSFPALEPKSKQTLMYARLGFINPEWMDEAFDEDSLDDKEVFGYRRFRQLINSVLGEDGEIDKLEDIEGAEVGIRTYNPKKDPSQLNVAGFYELKS